LKNICLKYLKFRKVFFSLHLIKSIIEISQGFFYDIFLLILGINFIYCKFKKGMLVDSGVMFTKKTQIIYI
jgi:hypothetical protein